LNENQTSEAYQASAQILQVPAQNRHHQERRPHPDRWHLCQRGAQLQAQFARAIAEHVRHEGEGV